MVFVGYEQVLPDYRGMVLLDATADIDGVNELCHWRRPVEIPQATYERLEIVHVPSVAEGTLTRWLRKPENRREYVRHILETVRSHVEPGQKALLVCKLDIADARPVIDDWSDNVRPFLTAKDRKFSWKFEGRLLSLTWWGGYGIGANHWKEADAVLLFDDFHLPRHANIAVTQGLKRASATEQPLIDMTAPNSISEEARQIRDGHLLRRMKQMALRGRSREFDEAGVCGAQKLVVTGDYKLLMANLHRVFPHAKFTGQLGGKATNIDRLLGYLSNPGVPARVSTKEIGGHFGRPWREFSHDITGRRDFDTLLSNAGWSYVSKRGPSGAYFERTLGVYRRRLIELLRFKRDDVGVLRPQGDEQSLGEPQGTVGSAESNTALSIPGALRGR